MALVFNSKHTHCTLNQFISSYSHSFAVNTRPGSTAVHTSQLNHTVIPDLVYLIDIVKHLVV